MNHDLNVIVDADRLADLKRQITPRWNILAGEVRGQRAVTAFAQLEYILAEAGLLGRRRNRKKSQPEPDLPLLKTIEHP